MNKLLCLKGRWLTEQASTPKGLGSIPANAVVKAEKIRHLAEQLLSVENHWLNPVNNVYGGALISCQYDRIIPKSRRIQRIFVNPDDCQRGSRYVEVDGRKCHLFTYFVPLSELRNSIERLNACATVIEKHFNGAVSSDQLKQLRPGMWKFSVALSCSMFSKLVADCYCIDKFFVKDSVVNIDKDTIVTLYRTHLDLLATLKSVGLNWNKSDPRIVNESSILLNPEDFKKLMTQPALVAMTQTDLNAYSPLDRQFVPGVKTIVAPSNEPTVGVIDTGFDKRVYFKDWVEYHNTLGSAIPMDSEDLEHGTAVSQVIVDGPNAVPDKDDHCGHFRVRHFCVSTHHGGSSAYIIKTIRKIVSENRDIKVWNLSLGSAREINENFISLEAAELDRLQFEYDDILFIVAGTNRDKKSPIIRIGSPADSINSLVVNACTNKKKPVSYYRTGPVLSFFNKPDVSYYGGDRGEPFSLCSANGEIRVSGTSFAAPWVTRKAAYLMHIMKFSREITKALLIDSAGRWHPNTQYNDLIKMGYGVIPQTIEEVVNCQNDEIRFFLEGSVSAYKVSILNLPIPRNAQNKFPYYARATLCYFPNCSREQGVDYTLSEMDILFGRVDSRKSPPKIISINKNKQDSELDKIYEADARQYFRKWDNVKLVHEELKTRGSPKLNTGNGLWGLKLTTKERLSDKNGKDMKFGVLITLKEMNGENRYKTFYQDCIAQGLIVNEIDIQERIDVHLSEETELELEG